MRFISFTLFFLAIAFHLHSQNISAEQIIEKSIEYHDPDGILLKKELNLDLIETRPNGADRNSTLVINIKKDRFELVRKNDGQVVKSEYKKGKVSYSIDGEEDISKEDIEKHRLNDSRTIMLKNYYQYLWLLPMKLKDEGTNFNPLVKKVDFFGKTSLEVRVTYDPNVGNDVWYFYFNPETYALQGYRFYHDEEKNDGEYIILDNEVKYKNIRLPKERKWYTHKEDKFLGTDILIEISY